MIIPGVVAGSRFTTSKIASVPPVDAPIAIIVFSAFFEKDISAIIIPPFLKLFNQ